MLIKTQTMKPEIKTKWLDALRSGKYQQGTETLCQITKDENDNETLCYCCLGVLTDLYHEETKLGYWMIDEFNPRNGPAIPFKVTDSSEGNRGEVAGTLPAEVRDWAGLTVRNPELRHHGVKEKISSLNDSFKLSFTELADLIEPQL